ncbi:MAG: 16S rRNA processing protein RimM [Mollicutes bacterium]|jgi:16S rRNA processing protein RimM|nr:16S rRNA processing protein RimM [Mollicutes bacterium]
MEYIYIGDIVNTHGIKGEVRIISDFKFKDQVFKKGIKVYVGRFKDELIINSYRTHKIYDMVTFEGINNINDVIIYKGDQVYINRNDIEIDGYLNEDLIGLDVYVDDKNVGKVNYIMKSKAHDILVIGTEDKKYMVPYVDEFVKKIDLENKSIHINKIEGLIDEN